MFIPKGALLKGSDKEAKQHQQGRFKSISKEKLH